MYLTKEQKKTFETERFGLMSKFLGVWGGLGNAGMYHFTTSEPRINEDAAFTRKHMKCFLRIVVKTEILANVYYSNIDREDLHGNSFEATVYDEYRERAGDVNGLSIEGLRDRLKEERELSVDIRQTDKPPI